MVAAEHDADREMLAGLLEAAGCSVTACPGEASLIVEAPDLGAADLNRLAGKEGITLRQLSERTRSLERAFFALTSSDPAEVRAGQEMGAIR